VKVIIVGAGFGGLSAAAKLAYDGHDVTILEKNSQPGGRARRLHADGYTFDMGPSWYLMPEVFESFFDSVDRDPQDYYELNRLDPGYRMFFEDDVVDMPADLDAIYDLFDTFEENGAEKLQRYLDDATEKYENSMETFLYKEYEKPSDFFTWDLAKTGLKFNPFTSMKTHVDKYFDSNKAKKIVQYTLVFLGGSPSTTPSIYSLMSHVDMKGGVWYPDGGIGSVVDAFEEICYEEGVSIHYDQEVSRVNTHDDKATSVTTVNEDTFYGDTILMNADYHHAETELVPDEHQTYGDDYWESTTVAPSAFLIYLGLDKELPSLKHHSLFVHHDWVEHFESIFDDPSWPDKPSYYVCNASKTDDDVAPPGKEALFALVPIASGLEDTESLRSYYAEKILADMERRLDISIREHIDYQKIFTINDFAEDYNAFKGTGLGLTQTLWQTALFRPNHQSDNLDNLYYTGQFTHPGIGVPMTLISSDIVSDMITTV
jgi:phytoene desaturase